MFFHIQSFDYLIFNCSLLDESLYEVTIFSSKTYILLYYYPIGQDSKESHVKTIVYKKCWTWTLAQLCFFLPVGIMYLVNSRPFTISVSKSTVNFKPLKPFSVRNLSRAKHWSCKFSKPTISENRKINLKSCGCSTVNIFLDDP